MGDVKQNGDIMGNIIGNVKDGDADAKKSEEKFNVDGLNAGEMAVGPHRRQDVHDMINERLDRAMADNILGGHNPVHVDAHILLAY